jgi:hypothetical protein
MKKSKRRLTRTVVVLIVLIIIIVAVSVLVVKFFPNKPAVGVPVYAPKGQLVPQFPSALILDKTSGVSNSYSINYSTTTNQYTAEYNSSSTVKSLYTEYQSYLSQNNWTISGSLTTNPAFDAINAAKGNDQLQIVISTQDKGSHVTITEVVK